MKKYFFFFFLILLSSRAIPALAHTPVLMLQNNEDGTLTVEGGFSTGAGAEGVNFYVKTLKDGKIIFSRKFPESSDITVQIPREPYQVVFDGGPGHKVVKTGPAPPGGFTVNAEAAGLPPEKSDATGIPVPLPVLLGVIAVAVILVFVIPQWTRKDR